MPLRQPKGLQPAFVALAGMYTNYRRYAPVVFLW
jgi:hypothetical protein